MSTTAKCLINSKYASNAGAAEYTAGSGKRTIVDKFTGYNSTGSPVDLSIYIVPSGGSNGASNLVEKQSVSANTGVDFTKIQNQILESGDSLYILAGTGSAVCIRASGREVTT